MNQFQRYKLLAVIIIGISLSCTEAYELKTESFESLLVVEATITDELKRQEVKLSKTLQLESNAPNNVTNARVWIESSNGTKFNFDHDEAGLYRSLTAFKAQLNETYTLNITLSDGNSYVSTAEILPQPTALETINAALVTVNGEQGIQVFANSSSTINSASYFKYDYEETYKIDVPQYSALDLNPINVEEVGGSYYYELELTPKLNDVRSCYSTNESTDINLVSLNESQNNFVEQFPVRFIKSDNGILRERYSILVKQYVQSFEAYNFYKILKKLGTVENIFTENQPGFIQGNLSSTTNVQEKIIGFFQVSSVSTKRIFFNHSDFNIPKPPYLYECIYYDDLDYNDRTTQDGDRNDFALIFGLLNAGTFKYYSGQHPLYSLVSVECADCTSFSSTVIPEFWEE